VVYSADELRFTEPVSPIIKPGGYHAVGRSYRRFRASGCHHKIPDLAITGGANCVRTVHSVYRLGVGCRYHTHAHRHRYTQSSADIVALSVPVLGETVGWRRWSAVGIGFIGTLIIVRPSSGVFEPAALLAILCALVYAVYNLMTRLVSRHDRFETSLLYFGLVGMAASVVPAVLAWEKLAGDAGWLLAAVCVCSVTAHFLLIKALQLAEANVLQPFNYLILVWAMLMGWVFYGEVLDRLAIAGAALVVASGLYIGFREAKAANA